MAQLLSPGRDISEAACIVSSTPSAGLFTTPRVLTPPHTQHVCPGGTSPGLRSHWSDCRGCCWGNPSPAVNEKTGLPQHETSCGVCRGSS